MAEPDSGSLVPASPLPSGNLLDLPIRLDAGETLVWSGQPRSAQRVRLSLFGFLLGLTVTGLAVGWITVTWMGLDWFLENVRFLGILFSFLPCCGVPFLLMGIWILLSPLRQWRAARRTCYLLTTKRAVICEPGWGKLMLVKNYQRHMLRNLRTVEYPDGSGDLIFEEFLSVETETNGIQTSQPVRRGFLDVERVRELEALVRRTLHC